MFSRESAFSVLIGPGAFLFASKWRYDMANLLLATEEYEDSLKQSTFIQGLSSLLAQSGKITKEQRDKAIELIKLHYLRKQFDSYGPCLNCKSVYIDYKPCRSQQQKGSEWLKSFFGGWIRPARVEANIYRPRPAKVNGYVLSTIQGYLCEDCKTEIDTLIEEAKEKDKQERQRVAQVRAESEAENTSAIIKGEIKVSAYRRYQVLCSSVSKSGTEELRSMDYKDFLNTYYWDIIRKYMLKRADYKCSLCNTQGQLQVHHKTYEHHGEEHLYLDDLIVLCDQCHGKFHDKLGSA